MRNVRLYLGGYSVSPALLPQPTWLDSPDRAQAMTDNTPNPVLQLPPTRRSFEEVKEAVSGNSASRMSRSSGGDLCEMSARGTLPCTIKRQWSR